VQNLDANVFNFVFFLAQENIFQLQITVNFTWHGGTIHYHHQYNHRQLSLASTIHTTVRTTHIVAGMVNLVCSRRGSRQTRLSWRACDQPPTINIDARYALFSWYTRRLVTLAFNLLIWILAYQLYLPYGTYTVMSPFNSKPVRYQLK